MLVSRKTASKKGPEMPAQPVQSEGSWTETRPAIFPNGQHAAVSSAAPLSQAALSHHLAPAWIA